MTEQLSGCSVLFVAAFDSQLKWCSRLWLELQRRGARCRAVTPGGRADLSPEQIAATGIDAVERLGHADLIEAAAASDVVVCALIGPQIRRLTADLDEAVRARGLATRPIVVTGWVGVIIEKITAGYLDRSGADVVAVNAAHELRHFRSVAQNLSIDDSNLLLTGLPIVSTTAAPQQSGPITSVVFADQPTVPATRPERRYLYERLVEYARRHPDREVLLKPRHRKGEDTIHRMQHHPEDVLSGVATPPNFRIDYRPIPRVLDETDLLLTVSSTACLEALERGRRTALVMDLGVHERFGNQVFVESGLLRTFEQIAADDIGTPDPAWLANWFPDLDADPATLMADRVSHLLDSGDRPSSRALDSSYHRAAMRVHHGVIDDDSEAPLSALRRRQAAHGTIKGLGVHMGFEWVPPAVRRPVRRWWLAR